MSNRYKRFYNYLRQQIVNYLVRFSILAVVTIILLPSLQMSRNVLHPNIEVIPSGEYGEYQIEYKPHFQVLSDEERVNIEELIEVQSSAKDALGEQMPKDFADISVFNYNNAQIDHEELIFAIDDIWYWDALYDLYDIDDLNEDIYSLTVLRNGDLHSIHLKTYETVSGKWSLGLLVKNRKLFSGTASFNHVPTGQGFAIGHSICDATEFVKSDKGKDFPEPVIKFLSAAKIGEDIGVVIGLTDYGVVSKWDAVCRLSSDVMTLGFTSKKGDAYILTDMDHDDTVETYEVEVMRKRTFTSSNKELFEVLITDQRFIDNYSGVITGMSGSPVIQDGYIIGALAYAIPNDEAEYSALATYARDMVDGYIDIDKNYYEIPYFTEHVRGEQVIRYIFIINTWILLILCVQHKSKRNRTYFNKDE